MANEREEVLTAALDEFADVGLADACLESIAARARLESGAVRALFVDKQSLLEELLRHETEPMVSAIALAVEEVEDPRQLLRKSLQIYDQWLLMHDKAVRIFTRCALERGEVLQSLYQHSLLPSEFYEHLQRIINQGRLRCKNLLILSLLIDSLILLPHMMLSAVELMSPGQTAEQVLDQRFEAIIDLFENGLFTK